MFNKIHNIIIVNRIFSTAYAVAEVFLVSHFPNIRDQLFHVPSQQVGTALGGCLTSNLVTVRFKKGLCSPLGWQNWFLIKISPAPTVDAS
ncbi:hypothetical protein N752_04550 [Desulforamulus aquiferis]|nr:hypothetical protein N752_04550 [Desulforamulus aquiferis]